MMEDSDTKTASKVLTMSKRIRALNQTHLPEEYCDLELTKKKQMKMLNMKI